MSVEKAKTTFFNAEHYAVVGASTDRSKFGNKVLRWYKDHGIKATPVHPKEAFVEEIKTVSSIKELPSPKTTSLSVITPPKVTLGVLKSALMDLNVTGIWLQSGAEDGEVRAFVDSATEEQKNKVILGGPCILVQGETLAREKGKL